MLTTTAIAVVLIGSSATTASSVSASPRRSHPPHTTTRSSRPDRADWEKIKSAARLRNQGLAPQRSEVRLGTRRTTRNRSRQMTGGSGDSLDHQLHLGNGVVSQRADPRFRRRTPLSGYESIVKLHARSGKSLPETVARHLGSPIPGSSLERTTGLEPATFGLGSRPFVLQYPC
jgi:hypothetical protein